MSTNLSSHLSKFGIMFMLSNRLNRSCLSDDENRGTKFLSCLSRVVLVLPVVITLGLGGRRGGGAGGGGESQV